MPAFPEEGGWVGAVVTGGIVGLVGFVVVGGTVVGGAVGLVGSVGMVVVGGGVGSVGFVVVGGAVGRSGSRRKSLGVASRIIQPTLGK